MISIVSNAWFLVMMKLLVFPCLASENTMDAQKRIEHNIPVRVQSTPLHDEIFHITCFILADETMDYVEHNENKDACCREIIRKVLTNDVSVADTDEKYQHLYKYCLAHIASVPSIESSMREVEQNEKVALSQALADYSLVIQLTKDHYTFDSANPYSTDSPWWLNDSDGSSSDESSSDESGDRPVRFASIHSSLSEDGGMHRHLSHVMTVQTPSTPTIPITWNGTIFMMLVVPSDFFMDMDDPLESIFCPRDASDCDVEYHLVTNEVVDIEKPAFDSPQHVVGIELKFLFHQRQQESSIFQIEFATKVHTRYPRPVAGRTSTRTSEDEVDPPQRVRIGLPAPGIVSGTWTMHSQTKEQPMIWSIQEALKQQDGDAWLSTTVPAGSEEDYPLVTMVTMVFALLGAALTLRDLSLVSNWDET